MSENEANTNQPRKDLDLPEKWWETMLFWTLLPVFLVGYVLVTIAFRVVRIVTAPIRILKMSPELERNIDNYGRYWGYCPYQNSKWRLYAPLRVGMADNPASLEEKWPLDWYKTKKWYVNEEDITRLEEQCSEWYEGFCKGVVGSWLEETDRAN